MGIGCGEEIKKLRACAAAQTLLYIDSVRQDLLLPFIYWEADPEGAAFPRFSLKSRLAAAEFGQTAHSRQTESPAFVLADCFYL